MPPLMYDTYSVCMLFSENCALWIVIHNAYSGLAHLVAFVMRYCLTILLMCCVILVPKYASVGLKISYLMRLKMHLHAAIFCVTCFQMVCCVPFPFWPISVWRGVRNTPAVLLYTCVCICIMECCKFTFVSLNVLQQYLYNSRRLWQLHIWLRKSRHVPQRTDVFGKVGVEQFGPNLRRTDLAWLQIDQD